jgi:hypothetical protein
MGMTYFKTTLQITDKETKVYSQYAGFFGANSTVQGRKGDTLT